ncbi:hypothetical protein AVEN_210618-1 [Araneus ventricosus]|uniref:Uncharacterized protein n=1 Tax=Araneus ventricosus TaxID=182803 RepID=A0A4Y2NYF9_ARAVE|nr:hypothetical protein AVEN_210618-1 [Araneus ventricosus]
MLEGSLNIMIQKLAVLSQPRLTDEAVPSVFPGRPADLSKSNKTGREAQGKKIQRKESLEIEKVLQLNVEIFKEYEEKKLKVYNFQISLLL